MDKLAILESGEKVIKAIDGSILLAHNLMDFGRPAYQQYSEQASDTNIDEYYLLFGRYIGDKEYALDLSRHKDVRLEIEHSFDVTAATGFTTGTSDIQVWIWRWIDPDFSPIGYLKTSEKYHYTASGSAGEERKELPCLNPYRRILIRTYLVTKTIGGCITLVEMEVNDGAYKPFYGVPMEMCADDVALRRLSPKWKGELYLPASIASYTETFMSYTGGMLCNFTPKFTVAPEGATFMGFEAGRVYVQETDGGTPLAVLDVSGAGYQYVVSIPFDIPDVEDSYFKSGEADKVEIILTHAAAAADTRIVLDELVKY